MVEREAPKSAFGEGEAVPTREDERLGRDPAFVDELPAPEPLITNGRMLASALTKREWLTGKALEGMLANPNSRDCKNSDVALWAAMLAEEAIDVLNDPALVAAGRASAETCEVSEVLKTATSVASILRAHADPEHPFELVAGEATAMAGDLEKALGIEPKTAPSAKGD